MDYLRPYSSGELTYPDAIIPARTDRAPLDHDVLVTGIREGVPTPQDLAIVAQTLVMTAGTPASPGPAHRLR